MIYNKHSHLHNRHAFLSASKHHWSNYDIDKLEGVYTRSLAVRRGTELHALAENLIKHNVKLPKNKKALNAFVNDAIGYRMIPELILYYSDNAFGTADAVSFRNNLLRIHDLKTGTSRVSMRQLEIYAAFFCLEYEVEPEKIDIELRVYQGNTTVVHIPDGKDIRGIMATTILFDNKIEEIKSRLEE